MADPAADLDKALATNKELADYSAKLKDDLDQRDLDYNNAMRKVDNLELAIDNLRNTRANELDTAYKKGLGQGKLEIIDKWDGTARSEMPLRKPEIYRHGNNFKRWLKSFTIFVNAARMPENKRIDCLLTFLDEVSQSKVETIKLTKTQKMDFESSIEKIARAIEGVNFKSEWRQKLFNCVQLENESVTEFMTRLTDLAERCYGIEESDIKSQILLDCFLTGIRSNQISFEIIKNNIDDYTKAYQMALDLEGINNARKPHKI